MFKIYGLIVICLFLINCTNSNINKNILSKNDKESQTINILDKNKLIESTTMENLKMGDCATLTIKDSKTLIKFGIKGKLSYGYMVLDKNGKEKEFSSFPKVDFKNVLVNKISCPDKTDSLVDLHFKYLKNPKKYQGSNTEITSAQVGQCVHYGSTVGLITAEKDNEFSIQSQLKDFEYTIAKKEELEKIAVITDCLKDLKVAYEKNKKETK